ncbi:hypothetical protein JLK41_09200 [Ectopseudomonas khazarica]|uniref:hypothetical protein n=1 Tax=Ectopseudomonas khazarica TaxID=2502979 RepID=UPI001AF01901|nr:hypothetical protein [Pseudomonas khazarica]QTS88317.1 hypothetical protein JLK41_09200 [Pseudomonas khazarica]
MAAWLKLVPSWAWPWIAGAVLALVVGAGQQIRVISLQADLQDERTARLDDAGKLGACRSTRTTLLGQVIEQNAALADLRGAAQARAAEVRAIQQQAEGLAQQADQLAQQVLQERTPAGVDACTAASQAFDDELRRERAQ